ncbi:MAG: HAD hydrolase-like protein [Opitutae bacterium]
MIKHVVWDWNGTLVDDVDLCVDILSQILFSHGKDKISVQIYKNSFFFPVAKFYASLGLPSDGTKYEQIAENYISEYRNRFRECSLHPQAIHMVEKLKTWGITQSILSAGQQTDLEHFTSYYGLNNWMSHLDGANHIQATGKEDRVAEHFSKLNLKANQVLFVGDTFHDLEVAGLVQCRVLLFEQGHCGKERLERASVPKIKCLSEVAKWVHD